MLRIPPLSTHLASYYIKFKQGPSPIIIFDIHLPPSVPSEREPDPPAHFTNWPSSMDAQTVFDDRDLAIKYTGRWYRSGNLFEYLNTSTYTTSAGSSASFNFSGMYAFLSFLSLYPACFGLLR